MNSEEARRIAKESRQNVWLRERGRGQNDVTKDEGGAYIIDNSTLLGVKVYLPPDILL